MLLDKLNLYINLDDYETGLLEKNKEEFLKNLKEKEEKRNDW